MKNSAISPAQLTLPFSSRERDDSGYVAIVVSGWYEIKTPRGGTVKFAGSGLPVTCKDLKAVEHIASMLGVCVTCEQKEIDCRERNY